ncbi:MAG: hypothetical protein IT449_16365 [Phycisphaerales bacterium]|nr:hypothetical protein [Phycisphaerales bacterium]
MPVQFAVTASLLCVIGVLGGCRANPFSFSVDVVTSRLAQKELAEWEGRLVGMPIVEADELLGERNDTLEPLDAGPRWIIYNSPSNKQGESYLLARITPDNRIGQVGVWKRNRDGVYDIWRVKRLLEDCFTLTQAECEQEAGLPPAERDFVSVNTHFRAVFYEDSSFVTGGGQKYVILCFDDDDLCFEVRTVGALAEGKAPAPAESAANTTPALPVSSLEHARVPATGIPPSSAAHFGGSPDAGAATAAR